MFRDFAPNFEERKQSQEKRILKLRQGSGTVDGGGNEWTRTSGNYRRVDITRKPYASRQEHLRTSESFQEHLIEEMLDLKERVVYIDEGGLGGMSALRFLIRFSKEVEAGRLVVGVSSVGFNPNTGKDWLDIPLINSPDDYRQAMKLYDDPFVKKHLHYINADANSLLDESIVLSNGEVIPLASNVDILHECSGAVAHTYTPEEDIFNLGRLLSPEGLFLYHDEIHQTDKDAEVGRIIGERRLINELGLQKVTSLESGPEKGLELSYVIFKAPKAPLIS
jgi:hypothetical protein